MSRFSHVSCVSQDAICDLISTFNDLDAAIAEGQISVEREGGSVTSPQHTAWREEDDDTEEEEDASDNFIYKFLQSRLKPYVEGRASIQKNPSARNPPGNAPKTTPKIEP